MSEVRGAAAVGAPVIEPGAHLRLPSPTSQPIVLARKTPLSDHRNSPVVPARDGAPSRHILPLRKAASGSFLGASTSSMGAFDSSTSVVDRTRPRDGGHLPPATSCPPDDRSCGRRSPICEGDDLFAVGRGHLTIIHLGTTVDRCTGSCPTEHDARCGLQWRKPSRVDGCAISTYATVCDTILVVGMIPDGSPRCGIAPAAQGASRSSKGCSRWVGGAPRCTGTDKRWRTCSSPAWHADRHLGPHHSVVRLAVASPRGAQDNLPPTSGRGHLRGFRWAATSASLSGRSTGSKDLLTMATSATWPRSARDGTLVVGYGYVVEAFFAVARRTVESHTG